MLKAIIILLIGAGIGAAMGYFGKCHDGKCPLTANPLRGTLWGICLAMIIAYPMIINAFRKPIPESKDIIHVKSSDEFNALTSKKDTICLIDFYADWCAPCRSLAPTINRLADEFKGKVNVIKINVDNFPNLAREYNANTIPLVIIIQYGKEIERIPGAQNFNTYSDILNKLKNNEGKTNDE